MSEEVKTTVCSLPWGWRVTVGYQSHVYQTTVTCKELFVRDLGLNARAAQQVGVERIREKYGKELFGKKT